MPFGEEFISVLDDLEAEKKKRKEKEGEMASSATNPVTDKGKNDKRTMVKIDHRLFVIV